MNIRIAVRRAAAATLAVASLVIAGVAAQVPEGPPDTLPQTRVPKESTSPDAPLDAKKVERFAEAFVAVERIQQQTAQQLAEAADSQQARQVKSQADKKVIQAIQRTGLSPTEFDRIAERMTADPQLRSRIDEKVEQRRRM